MITTLSLLIGAAIGAAMVLIALAFHTPVPNLAAAIRALDTPSDQPAYSIRPSGSVQSGAPVNFVERVGAWLTTRARLTPSRKLDAQLRLKNISVARFFGEQALSAVVMAVFVLASAVIIGLVVPIGWTVPAGLVFAAALIGWFLPRIRLTSQANQTTSDASEALLVYLDLVILERLAGLHIADALANAAALSNTPLFVQLRIALNRAELARESPWTELERLAERLNLPELGDLAGIARLQDQGAPLTEALRARAAELRNAHVVARHQESDRITSRMDIPKTIPVIMVLALYAAPAILRLVT